MRRPDVLVLVLGGLLIVRGAYWLWVLRSMNTDERRRRGRGRVAAVAIALVRGAGSVVLGVALVVKVYDLAITLGVGLVLWEVGMRRRPQRQRG